MYKYLRYIINFVVYIGILSACIPHIETSITPEFDKRIVDYALEDYFILPREINHQVNKTRETLPDQDQNVITENEEQDMKLEPKLVPYEGDVEHIFFHPLIAYPELTFDDDHMSQGYNDWMVTIDEFKGVIKALYDKNYILIDLNTVYEVKEVDGINTVVRRTILLPEGKKPFVLSIDDVNYYEYMIEHGNVHKLILDESGNVATFSKNQEGEDIISRDNEIIPLLDQFVDNHPDFSFEGAKGTIALTGYEGILGYRTQFIDSQQYSDEKEEVLKIINRLKETGWTFASHSYGHINVPKVSYQRLIHDTNKWKEEVESLIGPTNIFIYPYGSRVEANSDKFNFLVDNGYHIICAIGPTSYQKVEHGAFTMDRRRIDGLALIKQKHLLADLFDADLILDKVNRPEKYWNN